MGYGHGGKRPGAGAPRGGVSETRRLLVRAINGGLAMAGRARGLRGDDAAVRVATAEHIVSDMILAGQGADVLKLAAVVGSPKAEDPSDGERSPLAAALGRLPGISPGPGRSQTQPYEERAPANSTSYGDGTHDQQSDAPLAQPFFAPQTLLPLADPGPPSPVEPAAQGRRAGGGYPPSGATPPYDRVGAPPFEKNQEGSE